MSAVLSAAGGYRLARRLDQGRINALYEAFEPGGRRRVVIRFFRRAVQMDSQVTEACRAEIARVARLKHPHIAAVYALEATPEGIPFIVREHVDGEPLSDELARRGRLDPVATARLMTPVALTLAAVHQVGVIHGELRPSKLFVRRAGDAVRFGKLVGFALWRQHGDRRGPGAQAHTARYTSPELIEGRADVDARADQFALAAIAYRLIAGVDAFPGDDVAAVLQAVLHQPARPLTELGVADAAVDAVIQRGLAKSPADRFESVIAFAAALEAAATGLPDEVTRPVAVGQIEDAAPLPARPASPPPLRPAPPAHPAPPPARSAARSALPRNVDRIPWDHRPPLVLLTMILGLAAGLAWWTGWRPPPELSLASLRELVQAAGR